MAMDFMGSMYTEAEIKKQLEGALSAAERADNAAAEAESATNRAITNAGHAENAAGAAEESKAAADNAANAANTAADSANAAAGHAETAADTANTAARAANTAKTSADGAANAANTAATKASTEANAARYAASTANSAAELAETAALLANKAAEAANASIGGGAKLLWSGVLFPGGRVEFNVPEECFHNGTVTLMIEPYLKKGAAQTYGENGTSAHMVTLALDNGDWGDLVDDSYFPFYDTNGRAAAYVSGGVSYYHSTPMLALLISLRRVADTRAGVCEVENSLGSYNYAGLRNISAMVAK